MDDFYALLELESDAPLSTIKAAYRRKASQLHPDRNDAADAAEKFKNVQAAYEILSNPETRRDYDENRRRSLLDNPFETAKELWQTYFNKVMR